jgi:hypothetical protein
MKKFALLISLLLLTIAGAVFGQSREDLGIVNRLLKLKMDGLIPMRFGNALDNSPITGARVSIEGIGDFVTNSEGIISFPERDDGFFTLVVSKAGFITTAINFEIKLNTVFNNRYSVSPSMRGEYVRIVLDWGERPADLDLHVEKQGGYHISYWSMHSAEDGTANLDRDERNSFGPETITITETDLDKVYEVYVIDYSNLERGASRELSQSGAVVRVYGRDQLLNTFTVPQNRSGNRWDVFRIVRGAVTAAP